jgi:DNA-binding PadR family transcriptional regulator
MVDPERRRRRPGRRAPGHMGLGVQQEWFDMRPRVGRGWSVRRGDVRDAILAVLAQEPMHGYRIIQELSEKSRGRWRPSAGSIYPTLQQLEDEGLANAAELEGKRVYSLTEAGREAAADATARGGPRWQAGPGSAEAGAGPQADEVTGGVPGTTRAEFREALYHLGAAVVQAAQVGSPETVALVKSALIQARKAIYLALAEQDEADTK